MWCQNCPDPFKTEVGKEKLIQFCGEKKGVAIKEFRLDGPEDLYHLLMPEINLKIIRLVRDPRSMFLSRRKLSKVYKAEQTVEKVFDDCEKTLDFFLDSKIARNVIFVRYEDISRFPAEITAQIYKKLDVEMSKEFSDNFYEATHSGKD